ncbi:MAG: hypothetical protein ACK5W0_02545 [Labrys sp. (in: a-proteobacteria)]|jgi:hypothetical protein
MAQMEAADRTFARFRYVARTVKKVSTVEKDSINKIVTMIDSLVSDGTIPSSQRPSNGNSLGKNIYYSIQREKRKDISKVLDVIRSFFINQTGGFPMSLSVYQLAVIALKNSGYLNEKEKHGSRP